MLKKYGFTLLFTVLGMALGQHAYATDNGVCTSNPTQPLATNTSSITNSTSNWTLVTNFATSIAAYSLVNCSNKITDNFPDRKTTSFTTVGSNVNFDQTITYAGSTYYKIVNSSSPYFNQYAYVTFQIQDTKSGKPVVALAKTVSLYNNATGESATQGVNIVNLKFYFTSGLTESTPAVQLDLGKVTVDMTEGSNRYIDSQSGFVQLTLNPENTKTCSLNNPIVTLPTIATSALATAGTEAGGKTPFSITATCSNGLANTLLYFTMSDNANVANSTNVLSNSNAATSNVGIRVYDVSNNSAINYGTEYSFGRLGTGSNPALTKNFYAKYYKKDNVAAVAGSVNAQATVMVNYK
ncbi:fimbrial protein [Acinetobacter sp. NRRL B-65365]|uniref:fimbrial protein n=1 Tax=Acinetobacter sp. NRRL B-65365 TaxID=1785092 RepID=UPI0007A0779E|nr:fimbrial protein [Acinetobacter sp. NRRL B-65365]KYQ84483.1 fimbrial protein [Acinetobacter sp. NRRL B-65365]